MRCWSCFRSARAPRSPRRCSSIISTAAWTSPNSRSSTCSSASCARSFRWLAAAPITSRPSGAAAMCCARRKRTKSPNRRPRSPNQVTLGATGEGGAERLRLFRYRRMSALGGKQTLLHLPACDISRMRGNIVAILEKPVERTILWHFAVASTGEHCDGNKQDENERPSGHHPELWLHPSLPVHI